MIPKLKDHPSITLYCIWAVPSWPFNLIPSWSPTHAAPFHHEDILFSFNGFFCGTCRYQTNMLPGLLPLQKTRALEDFAVWLKISQDLELLTWRLSTTGPSSLSVFAILNSTNNRCSFGVIFRRKIKRTPTKTTMQQTNRTLCQT